MKGIPHDDVVERPVPVVEIAADQHHFGVRVGGEQLGREADGRHVADGGAVAEQLVPVGAAEGQACGRGQVFAVEGGFPHLAVADAVVEGEMVVGFVVAEVAEGGLHGWLVVGAVSLVVVVSVVMGAFVDMGLVVRRRW